MASVPLVTKFSLETAVSGCIEAISHVLPRPWSSLVQHDIQSYHQCQNIRGGAVDDRSIATGEAVKANVLISKSRYKSRHIISGASLYTAGCSKMSPKLEIDFLDSRVANNSGSRAMAINATVSER